MAYISKYSGEDIDLRLDLINKLTPRNLLDNSDFRNPVNQRGQTSYNGAVYGIDRWVGDNADSNATITENGLIVTGGPYLAQILEKKHVGKTLTICAKDVNGGIAVATCTVPEASGYAWLCTNTSATKTFVGILQTDTGVLRVNITNHAGIAIEWVALYEGEYTIDTLPDYQPKGYGAELAECLRYFERLGGQNSDVLGNSMFCVSGFSSFITSVQYYPKRIPQPTVKLYDPSNYRLLFKTPDTAQVYTAGAVKSFDEVFCQNPFAQFRVNLEYAENQNAWVTLQRQDNAQEPFIDICADL